MRSLVDVDDEASAGRISFVSRSRNCNLLACFLLLPSRIKQVRFLWMMSIQMAVIRSDSQAACQFIISLSAWFLFLILSRAAHSRNSLADYNDSSPNLYASRCTPNAVYTAQCVRSSRHAASARCLHKPYTRSARLQLAFLLRAAAKYIGQHEL